MSSIRPQLALALLLLAHSVAASRSCLAAAAEKAAAEKTDDGWVVLSGDEQFAAWREDRRGWTIAKNAELDPNNPRRLAPSPGRGALVCFGNAANLLTKAEYQDVAVKCEFLAPKGSNSGVKLNGLYEIQILDTHGVKKRGGDVCGGVYPRAKLSPRYTFIDEGVAPLVNAAKPAGEWQTLEIEFVAPRFDEAGKKTANARFARVTLNDQLIHKDVELRYPTGAAWSLSPEVARGPLMLQGDHGPVAFRNVSVRELSP